MALTATSPMILHGLKLSYFTGKLEAYLRAKGIAHTFVEMDMKDFRRCARATGVAQMPQLELPDGTWLTDTTAIMERFEADFPEPAFRPRDPAAAFMSLLLEDYFDEWLWRPALYYRWAFEEDAKLMSAQIARTMLRDVRAPFWLRRRIILDRQRRVYMRQDGVTRRTAPQIEALYRETLAYLEAILSTRPFLFGARPCEADFGLFGPMFRHFSSDPTPSAIMRETAPHVAAWVTRLWATTPDQIAHAPEIIAAPDDLAPLLRAVSAHYLPYLNTNARAVGEGAKHVCYTVEGVDWRVPASPYRAQCLARLQRTYQGLPNTARDEVNSRLSEGAKALAQPPLETGAFGPAPGARAKDRHWRDLR